MAAAVITAREIRALDFQAVREQLAGLTVTPMARLAAQQLAPFSDFEAVERSLQETAEGRRLHSAKNFSPQAVEDIEPFYRRAAKGGLLGGDDLAKVALFLKGVRLWRQFFKAADNRELFPLLAGAVAALDLCEELARLLDHSVDHDGSVKDSASAILSGLRRRQRELAGAIRRRMQSYLRSPDLNRSLQELLITIRNGRYVLPVRQEYRGRVPGIIHDQSASGATLYIEPLPVAEMQNQLASLTQEEHREIERILRQISSVVAASEAALRSNREIYTDLDLISAKGWLSLQQGATSPQMLREPQLLLKQARHPLLSGPVVPLTVTVGDPVRSLVITGPNTGGKTVTLKTIGLLAVMAQSGLHIPAEEGSRLAVFRAIRADIGDEQSIVQSLSTFSGHLKNIIEIMTEVGPGALVLLDELGTGTDPSEGAALAKAILAELTRSGTLTVATTHSSELKLFAQLDEGMQNASMEFDQETLSPSYRLLQGIPGQSNALIIAEKLGLPASVLEYARGYLHRDHREVESVIASLVQDQQQFSKDSRQAASDRARAGLLLEQVEQEHAKLQARRGEIIAEAREEARWLVRRARRTADQLVRELQQAKEESSGDALSKAEAVRRDLQRLQEETVWEHGEERRQPIPRDQLAVGKLVMVLSLHQKGEILAISGDEALLQVGAMKVHAPLADLGRVAGEPLPDTAQAKGSYILKKAGEVNSSVDLRGSTLEEARLTVEKLIDDALCAGLVQVTIIHGKGTGRLKEGLRSFLLENSLVQELRGGSREEGGDGVTVVTLAR